MIRLLCLIILFYGVLPMIPVAAVQPDQPNIILFLVDDMGWQDTPYRSGTSRRR